MRGLEGFRATYKSLRNIARLKVVIAANFLNRLPLLVSLLLVSGFGFQLFFYRFFLGQRNQYSSSLLAQRFLHFRYIGLLLSDKVTLLLLKLLRSEVVVGFLPSLLSLESRLFFRLLVIVLNIRSLVISYCRVIIVPILVSKQIPSTILLYLGGSPTSSISLTYLLSIDPPTSFRSRAILEIQVTQTQTDSKLLRVDSRRVQNRRNRIRVGYIAQFVQRQSYIALGSIEAI